MVFTHGRIRPRSGKGPSLRVEDCPQRYGGFGCTQFCHLKTASMVSVLAAWIDMANKGARSDMSCYIILFLCLRAAVPARALAPPLPTPATSEIVHVYSRRGAVGAPAEDEAHLLRRIEELQKELASANRRLEVTRGHAENSNPFGKDQAGGQSRAGQIPQLSRIPVDEARSKEGDSVRRAVGREGSEGEVGCDTFSDGELERRVDAIAEYLVRKEKSETLQFILLMGAAVTFLLLAKQL
jgi:hypothetical protein